MQIFKLETQADPNYFKFACWVKRPNLIQPNLKKKKKTCKTGLFADTYVNMILKLYLCI